MKKLSIIICFITALCLLCSCSKLALESDNIAGNDTDSVPPSPVQDITDTDENATPVPDTEDSAELSPPDALFHTYSGYDSIYSVIDGSADISYGTLPEEIPPDGLHTLTTVNGTIGQIANLTSSVSDGTLVYTLYRGTLVICSEDEVLSELHMFDSEYSVETADNYIYGSENTSGVFLFGNTLAIVTTNYEYIDTKGEFYYTNIHFCDVSDPGTPICKNSIRQDGTFLSAVMQDGKLYTISSKFIKSADKEDVTTYIPHIYTVGASPIPAEKISVFEYSTCTGYTVATVSDFSSETFVDTAAVLGGIGRFYTDSNNIYMLFFTKTADMNSSITENGYEISEHTEHSSTAVIKYPLNGTLTPSCETLIDGCFTNDFSIHSLNGTLYFCAVSQHTDYTLRTLIENGRTDRQDNSTEIKNVFYELSEDFSGINSTVLSDNEIASVRFVGKYMCIDYYSASEHFDITSGKTVEGIAFPELNYEYIASYNDNYILSITIPNSAEKTLVFTMYNADDFSLYTSAEFSIFEGYLDIPSVRLYPEAGLITLYSGQHKNCIISFDQDGFELLSASELIGIAQSTATDNSVFFITDSTLPDKIYVFSSNNGTETAVFDLTVFSGAVG